MLFETVAYYGPLEFLDCTVAGADSPPRSRQSLLIYSVARTQSMSKRCSHLFSFWGVCNDNIAVTYITIVAETLDYLFRAYKYGYRRHVFVATTMQILQMNTRRVVSN